MLIAVLPCCPRQSKPPGPPTASTSSAPSSSSSSRTGLVPSASSSSTPYNQAPISNNRTAAAFTSTAATVSTRAENALWDEEHLMYEQVRERGEKGYARMVTNFGALNFEVRSLRCFAAEAGAGSGRSPSRGLLSAAARLTRHWIDRPAAQLFAGVAPRACYNFLSARRRPPPPRPFPSRPSLAHARLPRRRRSSLEKGTTKTSSSTASSRASWCVAPSRPCAPWRPAHYTARTARSCKAETRRVRAAAASRAGASPSRTSSARATLVRRHPPPPSPPSSSSPLPILLIAELTEPCGCARAREQRSTTSAACSPWPTRGPTPTGRSSTSRSATSARTSTVRGRRITLGRATEVRRADALSSLPPPSLSRSPPWPPCRPRPRPRPRPPLHTHPGPKQPGKHTVFGRLVGGQDILSKLERVPTDPSTDRPLKPVVLLDVEVFGDPFDEYKKRLEKRLRREQEEREGRGERERRREERAKDRTTCVSFFFSFSSGSPSLSLCAPLCAATRLRRPTRALLSQLVRHQPRDLVPLGSRARLVQQHRRPLHRQVPLLLRGTRPDRRRGPQAQDARARRRRVRLGCAARRGGRRLGGGGGQEEEEGRRGRRRRVWRLLGVVRGRARAAGAMRGVATADER